MNCEDSCGRTSANIFVGLTILEGTKGDRFCDRAEVRRRTGAVPVTDFAVPPGGSSPIIMMLRDVA